MTETTATTGTSARAAETKSADASAFTDESEPRAGEAVDSAAAVSGADPSENGSTGEAEPSTTELSETTEAPDPAASATGDDAAAKGEPSADTADPESDLADPDEEFAASAAADAFDHTELANSGPPRPTYTRPPGMVPPPDHPRDGAERSGVPVTASLAAGGPSGSGSYPTSYAAAPVSAPPRVTGRTLTGGGPGWSTGPESGDVAIGSARVGEPMRPRVATTPRGPRRARLHLKRVDPWSVMKFSFAVSLVLFIVVIVAAAVLYLALDTMGVFASINNTVSDLIASGEGAETFRISAQGVIGTAAVLGALNVLLFTSLATLGAFIYNVCADLVGGVEVTLAERD